VADEQFRRWDELQRRLDERAENHEAWRRHDMDAIEFELADETLNDAQSELLDHICWITAVT